MLDHIPSPDGFDIKPWSAAQATDAYVQQFTVQAELLINHINNWFSKKPFINDTSATYMTDDNRMYAVFDLEKILAHGVPKEEQDDLRLASLVKDHVVKYYRNHGWNARLSLNEHGNDTLTLESDQLDIPFVTE